ncbi:hypothetical protein DSUL_200002 [Desulfovibrionales bacterium]
MQFLNGRYGEGLRGMLHTTAMIFYAIFINWDDIIRMSRSCHYNSNTDS